MKKFVMTAAVAFALLLGANAADAATYDGGLIRKGDQGMAVQKVQLCLLSQGFTLPVYGADSDYGSETRAAIFAFQGANGLFQDEVVGPYTGAKLNMACDDMDTETETESETESETEFDSSNGEEAEIEDITIDEGDDDELTADKKGQEAFTFTVEVDEDGGALQVERVDLEFAISNTPGGGEEDLWDIIEAITIEVDGDEVAMEDTEDDEDWRGASEDTFRLTGLDVVVEAGDEVEFTVLLDIADLDEDDDLDLDIDFNDVEVRYTDEAGITDTESANNTSGDTATAVVESLDDFELDFDESNDNPDDDFTISLAEDVDMETLLIADVEVDGQDGELSDVDVTIEILGGEAGEDSDDFLSEVYFFVDGEEIDSDDAKVTLDGSGDGTVVFSFDLDDMEVEDEDEFEIEIKADFDELNDDSDHAGATVQVTLVQFDGEDTEGDDVTLADVLYTVGNDAAVVTISGGALVLDDSSINGYNEIGSDDNAAKVKFEVEVMADGDEDITLDGNVGTAGDNGDVYAAFVFEIDGVEHFAQMDGTLNDAADGSGTALLGYTVSIEDGSGDDLLLGDNDEINDGSTESYEVTIVVDATITAAGTGEYEIELTDINWEEDFTGAPVEGTLDVSLTSDEIDLLS